jgi:hypothetical protein
MEKSVGTMVVRRGFVVVEIMPRCCKGSFGHQVRTKVGGVSNVPEIVSSARS